MNHYTFVVGMMISAKIGGFVGSANDALSFKIAEPLLDDVLTRLIFLLLKKEKRSPIR